MLIKSIAQGSKKEQSFLKEYCFIHEAQTGLFDGVLDCCSVVICTVYEYGTCSP